MTNQPKNTTKNHFPDAGKKVCHVPEQDDFLEETDQPTLLSLSLGTDTGWAISTESGCIISGTARFRPRLFDKDGQRYLRFERWLDRTRDVLGRIDEVYFKEVRRYRGGVIDSDCGGFLAALTAWCEEHGIFYGGVPAGTIKKFIAGKDNAGNEAVIAAVKALGHQPKDNKEADALALLHCAREKMVDHEACQSKN